MSARKLGLAVKRGSVGVGGGVVVTDKSGGLWTICEVEFLRVRRGKGGPIAGLVGR